jgi:hypothetical protein
MSGGLAKAKEHLSALQSTNERKHVRATIACLHGVTGGKSAADLSKTPEGEVYEAMLIWVARDTQLLLQNTQDLIELERALSDIDLIAATWKEKRLQREPIREAMRKELPAVIRLHVDDETRTLQLMVFERQFGETEPTFQRGKRNESYIKALIQLVRVTLASRKLFVQQVQMLEIFMQDNTSLLSASYIAQAEAAIRERVLKAWEIQTLPLSAADKGKGMIALAKLYRETQIFSKTFDTYLPDKSLQVVSKVKDMMVALLPDAVFNPLDDEREQELEAFKSVHGDTTELQSLLSGERVALLAAEIAEEKADQLLADAEAGLIDEDDEEGTENASSPPLESSAPARTQRRGANNGTQIFNDLKRMGNMHARNRGSSGGHRRSSEISEIGGRRGRRRSSSSNSDSSNSSGEHYDYGDAGQPRNQRGGSLWNSVISFGSMLAGGAGSERDTSAVSHPALAMPKLAPTTSSLRGEERDEGGSDDDDDLPATTHRRKPKAA